jgi:hypothetical protein
MCNLFVVHDSQGLHKHTCNLPLSVQLVTYMRQVASQIKQIDCIHLYCAFIILNVVTKSQLCGSSVNLLVLDDARTF